MKEIKLKDMYVTLDYFKLIISKKVKYFNIRNRVYIT